ncbi:MAG: UMP kinase [Alphaproteobacteria bacterium GM202ARS2]|nr:UMP kinase [Alphaproteobacteria bacterium GM202ARS2]
MAKPVAESAQKNAPSFLGHRRILLKVSGEVLGGGDGQGFDPEQFDRLAGTLARVQKQGIQLAVVVGGGNIFRGRERSRLGLQSQQISDDIGMLATVMNGLVLWEMLKGKGCPACVMSALEMQGLCEVYHRRHADSCLQQGMIVILVGGSGHAFFTTDTAAALRTLELDCTLLLKGTKVDGVYDKDPMLHKDAKRYEQLSYNQIIDKELHVMDATAMTLMRGHKKSVMVFSIQEEQALDKIMQGRGRYTLIKDN